MQLLSSVALSMALWGAHAYAQTSPSPDAPTAAAAANAKIDAADTTHPASTTKAPNDSEVKPGVSTDPLDAFPKAEPGFTRHVIRLPIGNYENDLKVELLPGKVIETDCNTHSFVGQLEERTLDGWGYNYYVLPTLEGPISTQMACPDDTKQPRFVPINGSAGSLLHYNSRLPVVVYLPDEVELRWRTWVATPVTSADNE